ncbi:MAG: hypothetical protein Ta2A_02870 [Treponemataceae bacterium]|nr:MAG: hypothetical protein Ta2A_02870 [Treponemataceae bacterium]
MGFFDFLKGGAAGGAILSPLDGEVVQLESVKDEAFSSGVMGKGIAIEPTKGVLVSPVNGKIDSVTETKHAVSIVSDAGQEILIHIGMDTVSLKGAPFTARVTDGQSVKTGDVLIEFDIRAIKDAGLETVTPIVVINSDDFASVTLTDAKSVKQGDEIITTTK